jgi:hypothetical protein
MPDRRIDLATLQQFATAMGLDARGVHALIVNMNYNYLGDDHETATGGEVMAMILANMANAGRLAVRLANSRAIEEAGAVAPAAIEEAGAIVPAAFEEAGPVVRAAIEEAGAVVPTNSSHLEGILHHIITEFNEIVNPGVVSISEDTFLNVMDNLVDTGYEETVRLAVRGRPTQTVPSRMQPRRAELRTRPFADVIRAIAMRGRLRNHEDLRDHVVHGTSSDDEEDEDRPRGNIRRRMNDQSTEHTRIGVTDHELNALSTPDHSDRPVSSASIIDGEASSSATYTVYPRQDSSEDRA